MNRIIRAFAAFIVSICLILAPPMAYAASSWSITSAISAGSRTIVSATKGGYKSAVNIAPTAGRLGLKLIKGGNLVVLGVAVTNILGDGIDWVLDPANNRVKYTVYPDTSDVGSTKCKFTSNGTVWTANKVCQSNRGADSYAVGIAASGRPVCNNGDVQGWSCKIDPPVDKYLTAEQVGAEAIANARRGHAPSQQAVRDTAVEMVVSGDFDADLMSGAVPTSDSRPLIPAVPGNGNGNVTHGSDVGIGEGGMSGATPGQMGDAAKDAADAAKRAADAAKDAAKAAQDAAREASDKAKDLVNSGADAAEKAAAQDAAAQAAKDAAVANAQAERAAKAANDRAAAAERAAQAATSAAQAAAAQAAKDLAAAIAAGDAAAKAAAEAAKAAADKAVAEAKAKQEAAEKAAEKAKAEAAKPMEFELPPFCSWAAPVCDFIDWVKADPQLEEPEDTRPEIQDLTKYDTVDISQKYVTATGQCPPAADLNINFGVVKLSYEPLCIILDKLSGVIVAVAYISVGFMIIRTV